MIINIAKDFSRTPGARYKTEGKYSGEEFREKILLPLISKAIEKDKKLTIVLDGTAGFSTSFLEEAFGGLFRSDFFKNSSLSLNDIMKHIFFISNEDKTYIDEIKLYMNDAFNYIF